LPQWRADRSEACKAFEWAILYPDQVDAVVAIASTHAVQPQGVGWNAVARNAIMADPAWQGGTITEPAASLMRAWASRAWSATSRICLQIGGR
jgi:homoserine acetyltransferase